MFNVQNETIAKINLLRLAADFGSSGIKGCNNAPEVLNALSNLTGQGDDFIDIQSGQKLFSIDDISTCGFLKYDPACSTVNFLEGVRYLADAVIKKSSQIYAPGESVLFTLGGDHLISYPVIKAMLDNYSNLQVLHFDAHFDANSISTVSQPAHNNFVSYLCIEEKLSSWICVGQRGIAKKPKVLSSKLKQVYLQSIIQSLNPEFPVYVTIDVDAFDTNIFQAVSFPQAGKGLQMNDILHSIVQLKKSGFTIVGIDVCEYNPELDLKNYLYGRQLVFFIAKLFSILIKGNCDE